VTERFLNGTPLTLNAISCHKSFMHPTMSLNNC